MTRRRFLTILASVAAAAAPLGIAVAIWPNAPLVIWRRCRVWASSVAWTRHRRIERHFWYLGLDGEGVRQFLIDFDQVLGPLSRFGPWPDDVFTRFLLSTDFFRHSAAESRKIFYVGLYHPYATPCNNPLARLE